MKKRLFLVFIATLIEIGGLRSIPATASAQPSTLVSPVGAIWSKTLQDPTYSPPVAANRAIYLGSNKGVLYVLDAVTGKLKRKFETDYPFPCYPLVSGDGNVYLSTNNGALYALNAFTGELRWSLTETASEAYSAPPELPYYYVNQPAQSGDVVFISTPSSALYAVDTKTGTVKWHFQSKTPFITYPAANQGKVYFGDSKGTVYSLDALTGQREWSYKTGASIHYPPSVRGNDVFLGSTNGILYVLDSETGKMRWKYSGANRIESSPVVTAEQIYIGAANGKLFSLDRKNKHLKWKFDVEGFVVTQPVIHSDYVYVGSNDGKLYALDSSSGELIWVFDSKGDFLNQIAVDDNHVYSVANLKLKNRSVSQILALKSGQYPGVRVTTYAGKESILTAWITDFFSASARTISTPQHPTWPGRINNLLTWPIGFFTTSLTDSLGAVLKKSHTLPVRDGTENILEFFGPGIAICGFASLFSLTPFILILLSGLVFTTWILAILAFSATTFAFGLFIPRKAKTGQDQRKFIAGLTRAAIASSFQNYKLMGLVFLQALFLILLSSILVRYLSPIRVWSFYIVVLFIWILSIFSACLTHIYGLIKIGQSGPGPMQNNHIRDYFGRVFAISLTYILIGSVIIMCFGAGKSYGLPIFSAVGVALIALSSILFPFTSNFAVTENQSCFSSIKQSMKLASGNLISVISYLFSTALMLWLCAAAIGLIYILLSGLLLPLATLAIGSFVAVYLICLQSIAFARLKDIDRSTEMK